jgi:hypothetical protein
MTRLPPRLWGGNRRQVEAAAGGAALSLGEATWVDGSRSDRLLAEQAHNA